MGDNKLVCDSCDSKVDATRRFCIKTLPNTLVLQLKRFDLDFTVFQLYKLNSWLEFPFADVLDMFPYTHDGLKRAYDDSGGGGGGDGQDGQDSQDGQDGDRAGGETNGGSEGYLYRLRGVVIHTGEAGGGHYYSLIRNDEGQWSKFDDEVSESRRLYTSSAMTMTASRLLAGVQPLQPLLQ